MGNLQPNQFGSVMDGTYDAAAHHRWWLENTRATRLETWGKIRQQHTDAVQKVRDARLAGDRAGAARAMLGAAKARRVAETFGPGLKE